nr:unnamed protein product [Callosobruchus analis]
METFLGLCLLQRHISTTNVRRYFSYVDILYHHPIFPYVMSGRKFEKTLRVFCCSDKTRKRKIKVSIKNKKDCYGIKFFELTTSDGHLLNMEMYNGRTENSDRLESKTDTIIMNLMKPFLHKGHELYMDNYYNSVSLSQKLLNFKTHTTGTRKANRRGNSESNYGNGRTREKYWLQPPSIIHIWPIAQTDL